MLIPFCSEFEAPHPQNRKNVKHYNIAVRFGSTESLESQKSRCTNECCMQMRTSYVKEDNLLLTDFYFSLLFRTFLLCWSMRAQWAVFFEFLKYAVCSFFMLFLIFQWNRPDCDNVNLIDFATGFSSGCMTDSVIETVYSRLNELSLKKRAFIMIWFIDVYVFIHCA